MKKKILFGLSGGTLLALLVISVVLAFSLGNSDGVWEYVEDITTTYNAYCVTYGTGPLGATTARSRNDPTIQGLGTGIDENQLHYGRPDGYTCPTDNAGVTDTFFELQSGLGFNGNDAVVTNLVEDTPVLLGRITHYNRPILLTDSGAAPLADAWNFLLWTDLDIQIQTILCSNGQPPNEGSTFTFDYRINFEETPNSADPCPWDGPTGACWDRVSVGTPPPAMHFTCDDADEPVKGTYTIVLEGIQPHDSQDCSTQVYNSGLISTQLITEEQANTSGCLWAYISVFEPTAVTLTDLSALVQEGEVVVSWETTSEIGTLGFNLYRATSEDGERTLVNDELIISNLAPGSLDGATYTFTDELGITGDYYWLEEVEIDGSTTLYGPVIALAE